MLFVAVVQWLLVHWWVLIALLAVGAVVVTGWVQRRQQRAQWEQVQARALRYAMPQLDALHHREFENAVRELMRRDGCQDAVRVGGGGDLGADVKATDPFGRRWVIQCKHRRGGDHGSAVGTPDLQVLNGTARPVHGADIAVLVTNGRVTKPGVAFASAQRLYLVDRRTLAQWAAGSQPLWTLLGALPPPRRPTALS
ncbi:restriction endonuclease [Streptomyces ortus]|uniref:Restriction endonuclease n=1 Tax=Streptomyces ortus TaxID=2867268 RepID=A0ABT3UVY2_9ACTN|nr:restriction endonuclease [Streptomyces ortus]MCX4231716.1 restriction endonuclease [Streptomyces ortus]